MIFEKKEIRNMGFEGNEAKTKKKKKKKKLKKVKTVFQKINKKARFPFVAFEKIKVASSMLFLNSEN